MNFCIEINGLLVEVSFSLLVLSGILEIVLYRNKCFYTTRKIHTKPHLKFFISALAMMSFSYFSRIFVQTVKALANEDTLLPTQMFPRLPARATFVADTNFVSVTQKMFLILFRNILCRRQMFPSLRSPRNIMANNVSATMCPRCP